MKFAEMTSPDLAAVDREQTVVMVPIAAVEQHGPHLPVGTDAIICTAIAEQAERQLAQRVLLTPTVWLGASAHHLRFGATLNADLQVYVSTLCDIGASLLDDGYRRLLFINGHGGNVDPMRVALRRLQQSYDGALLAAGSYWDLAGDLIAEALDGDQKRVGHACEFETSMILHLRPELVAADRVADAGKLVADNIDGLFLSRDMRHRTQHGCTGRPDLASAEKGKALFDGIVDRLVVTAAKLLNEPLGREYQDFV